MANEFEIIENPTSTPEAVSTGYQRQNTNLVSQRAGLDLSVVEGGAGQVTVKISGPVDVNGVLYTCKSDTVLIPGAGAGVYYVYLSGSGDNLTLTLTQRHFRSIMCTGFLITRSHGQKRRRSQKGKNTHFSADTPKTRRVLGET